MNGDEWTFSINFWLLWSASHDFLKMSAVKDSSNEASLGHFLASAGHLD